MNNDGSVLFFSLAGDGDDDMNAGSNVMIGHFM